MPPSRLQVWSCGGGRQSAGIAALIALGELPPPDHACMVRLEGEICSVWPYVERYIVPTLTAKGVPFTAIPRADYATVDFWSGEDGRTIVLPIYSDQGGTPSKFQEFCSGEWKREVSKRWASEQSGWKARGIDQWIGISTNEAGRRRGARHKWIQPVYPLLDVRPTSLGGCLATVHRVGWPDPPRSRCRWCPNQSDREWLELTPEEFADACRLDDEIRLTDPHAFLHRKRMPLRLVRLNAGDDNGGLFGGCTSGMCY